MEAAAWLGKEKGAPTEKSVHTKIGGQPGNKNALGNSGGAAPARNQNAVTHGFFSKYLPEETLEIMEEIQERSPADMIWDQIQIQYAAIIRAQRIMFVHDQDDMTKVLKKRSRVRLVMSKNGSSNSLGIAMQHS